MTSPTLFQRVYEVWVERDPDRVRKIKKEDVIIQGIVIFLISGLVLSVITIAAGAALGMRGAHLSKLASISLPMDFGFAFLIVAGATVLRLVVIQKQRNNNELLVPLTEGQIV